MRILYIGRRDGFGIKSLLRQQKRRLSFGEQDGFFEASLYAAADVTEVTLREFLRGLDFARSFDAVVVNMKCASFSSESERDETLQDIAKKTSVPTGIFIGSAQAGFMLPEIALEKYDVIYKREPYRDRDRYDISESSKKKIIPTMISCPFARLSKPTLVSKLYCAMQPTIKSCELMEEEYEVGFSGVLAYSHKLRQNVWKQVKNQNFSTIGGLQQNPFKNELLADSLKGPRLKGRAYRDSLCSAKINLALDGIGEYTFRHQELLYLGAFMMCSPSIRDIELPMPLKEDEHYVSFDNLDNLVEKLNHYLADESERISIANSGRRVFLEHYNPQRHGQKLVSYFE